MEHIHMNKHVKYPKTFHLPNSEKLGRDDRIIKSLSVFEGKTIVITEKMDGENTTMYNDKIHARSLDGWKRGVGRSWVSGFHGQLKWKIPEDIRICGENMWAQHTIKYDDLESYFLGFGIYRKDTCVSWEETTKIFNELDITSVPVLYIGPSTLCAINEIIHNRDWREGFVIRNADEFNIKNWTQNIAKFVSADFKISTEHWAKPPIIQNKLK